MTKHGHGEYGLEALFAAFLATQMPIIHCWRTFLFSAIGMWSNSSQLPWRHAHQEDNAASRSLPKAGSKLFNKRQKNVKYPHTCQQGGTLHKPRAASWPSADLGQSCPRRNTPPHELWVVAPVISSKGGRNVSPLRYCRSCPSEQCTSLLERPAP